MQAGDLVVVDGVRTLLEVCDVISPTRFTAYWLVGTNWRDAVTVGAQFMDFVFERDVATSGHFVLKLYDNVEVEIVGKNENGAYRFFEEEMLIPSHWE